MANNSKQLSEEAAHRFSRKPIDLAANTRVVCFLKDISEVRFLDHMCLAGFEGFAESAEEGFSGPDLLYAIKEAAVFLKCPVEVLLSDDDELLQFLLKSCNSNTGWTWSFGGLVLEADGSKTYPLNCVSVDGYRYVDVRLIFSTERGKEVGRIACNLRRGTDLLDEGEIQYDVPRPNVESFEQVGEYIKTIGKQTVADKEAQSVAGVSSSRAEKTADKTVDKSTAVRHDKQELQKPAARPIHVNEFLVRRTYGKHNKDGHSLEAVEAIVSILPRNGNDIRQVKFNAYWCKKCKKYFMNEDTYLKLKKQGYICCKVVEEKDLNATKGSGSGYYGNLNDESLLHMYGYTVSQQADLSTDERRTIISFVIENKICRSSEVEDLLKWLIRSHEGRQHLRKAVNKWKSDLDWVRHYEKPKRKVVVDAIYAKV